MFSSLHAFDQWLSDTPFSVALQNATWAIPMLQALHILAIAVLACCRDARLLDAPVALGGDLQHARRLGPGILRRAVGAVGSP